ncbi:MAG: CAP domain-containing protein [Chromatiales bacterium]
MNSERARIGLSDLKLDPLLMRAAQEHTLDMAGSDYFDHAGTDNSDPGERIARQGYRWRFIAENIGCGQETPEAVVASWLASAGHRQHVLSAQARDVGVGLVQRADSGCRFYWTAVFAVRH